MEEKGKRVEEADPFDLDGTAMPDPAGQPLAGEIHHKHQGPTAAEKEGQMVGAFRQFAEDGIGPDAQRTQAQIEDARQVDESDGENDADAFSIRRISVPDEKGVENGEEEGQRVEGVVVPDGLNRRRHREQRRRVEAHDAPVEGADQEADGEVDGGVEEVDETLETRVVAGEEEAESDEGQIHHVEHVIPYRQVLELAGKAFEGEESPAGKVDVGDVVGEIEGVQEEGKGVEDAQTLRHDWLTVPSWVFSVFIW